MIFIFLVRSWSVNVLMQGTPTLSHAVLPTQYKPTLCTSMLCTNAWTWEVKTTSSSGCSFSQCSGAETFYFRSGSDFRKVSALAPTLALTYLLSQISYLKSGFFMFFMKEYQPNSHAGFYTKWILIFIYYLKVHLHEIFLFSFFALIKHT
jgi:hypothetical protein